MKKKMLIIPIISLMSISFMACSPTKSNSDTQKTQYSFDYSFSDTMNENFIPNITTETESFAFDWKELFEKDTNKYDKTVAKLSSLLAADSNDWIKFDLNGDKNSVKKPLPTQLGAKDYSRVWLEASSYEVDVNDLVLFNMSHFDFKDNNKDKQVFMISLAGTANGHEWASNFDFGFNGPMYIYGKDNHAEWTNRHHHKGFDIASNRTLSIFNNYINSFKIDSSEVTLLINGYSRGAAVANLLGKYYQDSSYKNFTYTFESPNTVDEDYALTKEYKNIFNIINTDDLIPCVPTNNMGFTRYGTDISVRIQDYKDEYNWKYYPREYNAVDTPKLVELLDEFGDREDIYTINEEFNKYDVSDDYWTEDDAYDAYNEAKRELNALSCGKYFVFEEPEEDEEGYWSFRWRFAPAAFIDALSCFFLGNISDGLTILTYLNSVVNLFLDRALDIIGDQGIMEFAEHFIYCHMPESFIEVVNHYEE